jgi:uncharacterized protein (TIGR02996 family)
VQRDDLYRAVLAEPDADEPRERFAEWLAANGETDLAELIRLQFEDARTPPPADPDEPDEEAERRAERMVALIQAHPEWRSFPEIPGIGWGYGSNFGFERGFLGSVMVKGSEPFTTHMGRVFEIAPVTTAVFEKVDDAGAAAIASSPFLSRLRHLSLAFCRVGDAAAEAIAASPHAANLRSLRFYRCGVGPRGAQALASSPYLAATLDLDLRGSPIGEAGEAALRGRFGQSLKVDAPEDRGRHPLLGPFEEKLVAHFGKLTSAMSAAAPADATAIECTVRNLPGAPDGLHTRVVHTHGNRSAPAQVQPAVRQAAGELARFWITEGGGFPGVRATMQRQKDGTWQVRVTRLDAQNPA